MKDRVRFALLDEAGGIHHDHAVGIARNHAQVMRDDDQRNVELARQILHQFENLRLNRHVEGGRRLVGDDEAGIAGKPDRDHHPLAHAAGELMRILIEPALRVGDADQPKQFDRARSRLLVIHPELNLQRLGDLQSDGQDRIERGHRLLEDHRDVAAADLAHLFVAERQQVAPVEGDAAAGNAPGMRRQKPHDRERRDRLARTGFADDGDDLAAVDVEAQPLDRAHDAARRQEVNMQIFDLEQGRGLVRIHTLWLRFRPIFDDRHAISSLLRLERLYLIGSGTTTCSGERPAI